MVKQDDWNAILFACLSIHEGIPVHVNPLGNRINITISHRSIPCHLSWFRQTYSKRPFGGAEQALCYLGRYTHRVAISNHRLVSFLDDQVTFRWRDRADNNQEKLLPLSLDEFLRRFLLHVLPKGFVRIRHFGFLANRRRATLLPLCFQVLGAA